jgi:L-asparaginase
LALVLQGLFYAFWLDPDRNRTFWYNLTMQKKNIHIIKMGGTIEFIDPSYEKINKDLMKLDTSIDNYLENLVKPHFSYDIEVVCEKDSREITKEDLEKLWIAVKSSKEENILITHGTFTMKNTAKFLEDLIIKENVNKKIIITGAMIPIVGFSISDASFNLGYSLASFNSIRSGVYICMNGGMFKADEVDKNTELFRFE